MLSKNNIKKGGTMSFNIEGTQIYRGFVDGARRLSEEKDRLNALNLFPVADKDTGTNMVITMKKTAEGMNPVGTPAEVIMDAFMNLLDHSHGNSGTILTLFFEGFKDKIPEGDSISIYDFASALESGADAAYDGVPEPMAGTILTVAKKCAQAGISMLEASSNTEEILKRISDEAHASLMQTPYQNPTLTEQRVVDSGAFGFCLIIDGFVHGIAPEVEIEPFPTLKLPEETEALGLLPYRFCTELVLDMDNDASTDQIKSEIMPLGEYFVLSSGNGICKIHIHTNEPESVFAYAKKYGTLKSTKVDDMQAQI